MDGAALAAYIRELLVLEIGSGIFVVCDNLATHKSAEAAAEFAGPWVMVPVTAILQSRLEPHRTGFRKTEGTSAEDRCENLLRPLHRHRRYLQPLQS